MQIRVILCILAFHCFLPQAMSQHDSIQIETIENEIQKIEKIKDSLQDVLSEYSFKQLNKGLLESGLPSKSYISHMAYYFEYAEEHEQAKWVAHVISPKISGTGYGRSNRFIEDSLVTTGSSQERDFFIRDDSKPIDYKKGGFGYDRGHLASAADFRWSKKAVEESFLYSNMSPMLPEFNREIWAQLESELRSYVVNNNTEIYVVTGPILNENLKKIPQSINQVSIPEVFYKIAYDPKNKRSIAFMLPHEATTKSLESFTLSIDALEKITGINYFPNIEDEVESQNNITEWFETYAAGSVEPIDFNILPKGTYNTSVGAKLMGRNKKITVCGTVVSSRNSNSGNAWLNLDKMYPDDFFGIMIKKEDLKNFNYDPVQNFVQEKICVEGEVIDIGGKPRIIIENEKKISKY